MSSYSYLYTNYMTEKISCPKCSQIVHKVEVDEKGLCVNCHKPMSDDPHDMTNEWIEFIAKRGEN